MVIGILASQPGLVWDHIIYQNKLLKGKDGKMVYEHINYTYPDLYDIMHGLVTILT